MTITPQDVNVALKRAGYDVVFDELSAATSTISVDLARTLLQLLPVDESDDAPINLFFGMVAGKCKSDEVWWLMHSMVSSAKYHGDAFLGLANGLVESFSWTADKGEALLAVYLDPSLDDQRGIFLAALNRFPRAQREDILKRAALDPALRPDVEERLDRQFRRAGAKEAKPLT